MFISDENLSCSISMYGPKIKHTMININVNENSVEEIFSTFLNNT
jgi:hypothetical protein